MWEEKKTDDSNGIKALSLPKCRSKLCRATIKHLFYTKFEKLEYCYEYKKSPFAYEDTSGTW